MNDKSAGCLTHDSSYYESKIKSNLTSNELSGFKYPLTASSIIVPALKEHKCPERRISFNMDGGPYKLLIFKAIIASYNYSFFDEFAAPTIKTIFSGVAHFFVEWLNDADIKNPYMVLKEYELYRFDKLNNHGGSSAIIKVRTILFHAIYRSNELKAVIDTEQLQYLHEIYKTKAVPNSNKKQISIASYFGQLDWLRDDNLGVGNQLYETIASPKITIRSLRATASVLIMELYEAKLALKSFFMACGFSRHDFELTGPLKHPVYSKRAFTGNAIYYLLLKYHRKTVQDPKLRKALILVLLSNVSNKENFLKVLPALESEIELHKIFFSNKGKLGLSFLGKCFSISEASNTLFELGKLSLLCQTGNTFPISNIENLMFAWLMASLVVQPSDISKLNNNSFRYLKVGSRVTHLECEYFKGRANSIHQTNTLSTKSVTGKAVYCYISQHSDGYLVDLSFNNGRMSHGLNSIMGVLSELLSIDFIREATKNAHLNSGNVPIVIPEVLIKLVQNIIRSRSEYDVSTSKVAEERVKPVVNKNLFTLQAIKNSAVHAFSDPYTLHYLINRNSHTNKTEKLSYLNEDNEEWLNASGRITRNVMIDLINNVFNLSLDEINDDGAESNKAYFNSEFLGVTDCISTKSQEMLMRLKVVTQQEKGKISEVGVLSLPNKNQSDDFPYLYVLDSPITVFKMKNYLYEFELNYKKLLCVNPDFLYKTALPTVEWISYVLSIFTKSSVIEGNKMFKEMKVNNVSISVFHSI